MENICLANVAPPEPFNFSFPEGWAKWRKRFERYINVSGQSAKVATEQIDLLFYIMGEKSEEVLLQFGETPTTLADALNKFDKYFNPKRNVIFERFKFNSRVQRQGESVDSFITELHAFAENCEYGSLREDLIRDRIVVGMLNTKVSEQMQLKSDLTLKIAVDTARQAEIQIKQTKIINDDKHVYNIQRDDQLRGDLQQRHNGVPQRFSHDSRSNGYGNYYNNKNNKCKYCGYKSHDRENCPAKDRYCNICNLRGHFSNVCRKKNEKDFRSGKNKKVNSVEIENMESISENNENVEYMIGTISELSGRNFEKSWYVQCIVAELDKKLNFLIDTGADCVCIPKSSVSRNHKFNILQTNTNLKGPDGNLLKVCGVSKATLIYNDRTFLDDAYIVEGLSTPILGRKAIVQLNILQPPAMGNFSVQIVETEKSSGKLIEKFPDLFREIGEFKGEINIRIKNDAIPFVQTVPRRVPIPLLPKLKAEIERLIDLGIIERMDDVTEWVSPIVVVPKQNDEIRLCVDYTQLNKAVLRPYYPMPNIEHSLASIKDSKIFSKIDANKGFYQIKLSRESQLLTCFICPFGRFIFKRLPFGISCAPEYFVSKFEKILNGIENCISHVDDILIYGKDSTEHDAALEVVLDRLNKEGVTINKNKSCFGVEQVTYLGFVLSANGVSVDPERIRAIVNYPRPENKTEVQRFLGMVNFVAKFIPNRSNILQPINVLTGSVEFVWEKIQENAFLKIKDILTKAPTLAFYDPSRQIIISSDASCYGIGACLFQVDSQGFRQVVSYISRTMTDTERHYAQIEREALGITWAAEKFAEYITGIQVIFETDHKPLVQILQSKSLDTLTPRLQRFRMRLMRYDYSITYVPGKYLKVADALSRSPVPCTVNEPQELGTEIEAFVRFIVRHLPVKDYYMGKISNAQKRDPLCRLLCQYASDGWPSRDKLPEFMIPYYQYRNDISFSENLVLKDTRIVIPPDLQKEVLGYIHSGHQGITKCRRLAQTSVWWLGLSQQLEEVVKNCPNCVEERYNSRETFKYENPPTRPMERIGLDLFKCDKWYLIITDYYSRYFDFFQLTYMTEDDIIQKVKEYFSRYGICSTCRSDNGPQFQSKFKQFAFDYHFEHITSSPYYSQSNGAVEAAVKVAKRLIKKCDNIYEGLLNYRSTPLANGFSPAELMMGRKFKSLVPILPRLLKTENKKVMENEHRNKEKQITSYNKRYRTKDLPELKKGDRVWIIDLQKYGKILEKLLEPRSYLIEADRNRYRRNRRHLISVSNVGTEHSYDSEEHYNPNENYIIEDNIEDNNVPIDQISTPEESPPGNEETVEDGSSTRVRRQRNPPSWMKDYVRM